MRRLVPALAAAVLVAACGSTGTPAPAVTASTTSSVSTSVITSSSPVTAPPLSTSTESTPSAVPVQTTPTPSPKPEPEPVPEPEQPVVEEPAPEPPPEPVPANNGLAGGTVVVIDPGHNGANGAHPEIINREVDAGFGQTKACNTTGTSTNAGFAEHEFTWAVSNAVAAILEQQGITVVMTRDSDDGVGPCVNERAAVGNVNNADAVVSIHGDGSAQGDRGFYAMTAAREPAGDEMAALSVDLAASVRDALVQGGLSPSNYVGSGGLWKRDDLGGLNLSLRPTTMIEMGNMRDSQDAALMTSEDGQHQMAAAIAQGILSYLQSH